MLLTFLMMIETFEGQEVLLSFDHVILSAVHLWRLVTFSSLQFLSNALHLFKSIDFSNRLIQILVFRTPRSQSRSYPIAWLHFRVERRFLAIVLRLLMTEVVLNRPVTF